MTILGQFKAEWKNLVDSCEAAIALGRGDLNRYQVLMKYGALEASDSVEETIADNLLWVAYFFRHPVKQLSALFYTTKYHSKQLYK